MSIHESPRGTRLSAFCRSGALVLLVWMWLGICTSAQLDAPQAQAKSASKVQQMREIEPSADLGYLIVNGIVYCGKPGVGVPSTCLTAAKDLAKTVVFPSGRYFISSSLVPYSNLKVQCAQADVVGSAGTVFAFKPGAAIWGVANPNADATGGSPRDNQIIGMDWSGCGFDLTADREAKGAVRIKGILFSQWHGIAIFVDNNSVAAWVEDGGNYERNGGDYDNDIFSLRIYNRITQGATGTGVYITGDLSEGACSNDNHHYGGSFVRLGYAVRIDCGNNNSFFGGDWEDSQIIGLWLTHGGNINARAASNIFISIRFENKAGTNIQIDDDGPANNTIIDPYNSGVNTWFKGDRNHQNTCIGCLYGKSTQAFYASWFGWSNRNGNVNFGINKLPELPNQNHGGLDVAGPIQTDTGLIVPKMRNGCAIWSGGALVSSGQPCSKSESASLQGASYAPNSGTGIERVARGSAAVPAATLATGKCAPAQDIPAPGVLPKDVVTVGWSEEQDGGTKKTFRWPPTVCGSGLILART